VAGDGGTGHDQKYNQKDNHSHSYTHTVPAP